MRPVVQSLRPFRSPSAPCLRRCASLGAIALGLLLGQPARSQESIFFGTAAYMYFSCDRSIPVYHGKAIALMEQGIGAVKVFPLEEREYQFEASLTRVPGGSHSITGKWWLEIKRGNITYTSDPKNSELHGETRVFTGSARPLTLNGRTMIEHIDFFAEDNPVVTCRPSPN